MSESRKLLIGLAVVGLICCCMAVVAFFGLRQFGTQVENMANGDPTSVAKIQDDIAEFDIPPGYQPIAMTMFMYDMVSLTPDNATSSTSIMMMQYNGIMSGNDEQIAEQLRQAAEQQSNPSGTPMQVVDSFDTIIRGETVIVTVSEGEYYQGFTMRQWTTVFQGNKGPTILIIQGPAEIWEDQLVDDFIKSIR